VKKWIVNLRREIYRRCRGSGPKLALKEKKPEWMVLAMLRRNTSNGSTRISQSRWIISSEALSALFALMKMLLQGRMRVAAEARKPWNGFYTSS
jgi:hypothetical protein